jgi:hypothetical protein
MEIQDLRGEEFIHFKDDSTIYIIGRGKDGKTVIHYKGEPSTSVYRDEQVVDFIERGIWILTKQLNYGKV